jgi:hypothetical protein
VQFYIIDTVGIQPTQQLVLQLDGGRFYWTACDFTLMIQLESNQRNSWCSNWTEGDFTLLRRRETALLGKGKSMSNNVNSHFPTGQEAREVGRPDSGFGRPGFRVWATRIPGLGDSSFGSRVQRLWSRDSVRDSSGEAIARGRFMNRCRLCIKRAAPGRLGAAEAGSGARRRLGAARMRRGTYAEPPRHAGTVAQSPPGVAPRAGTAEPVGTSRGSLPVGASSTVATTSRSESCTPVGPPRGCGHSRAATWLRRHGGA